jgi:hypothetical protein
MPVRMIISAAPASGVDATAIPVLLSADIHRSDGQEMLAPVDGTHGGQVATLQNAVGTVLAVDNPPPAAFEAGDSLGKWPALIYFVAFIILAVACGVIGRNITCGANYKYDPFSNELIPIPGAQPCTSRCFFHFAKTSNTSVVPDNQMSMSMSHPYGLLVTATVIAGSGTFFSLMWWGNARLDDRNHRDGPYQTYKEFHSAWALVVLPMGCAILFSFCAAILLSLSAGKWANSTIEVPNCAKSLVALSWTPCLLMASALAWQARGVQAMNPEPDPEPDPEEPDPEL